MWGTKICHQTLPLLAFFNEAFWAPLCRRASISPNLKRSLVIWAGLPQREVHIADDEFESHRQSGPTTRQECPIKGSPDSLIKIACKNDTRPLIIQRRACSNSWASHRHGAARGNARSGFSFSSVQRLVAEKGDETQMIGAGTRRARIGQLALQAYGTTYCY